MLKFILLRNLMFPLLTVTTRLVKKSMVAKMSRVCHPLQIDGFVHLQDWRRLLRASLVHHSAAKRKKRSAVSSSPSPTLPPMEEAASAAVAAVTVSANEDV